MNIGWLQQATEFLRLFIAVSMRHRGVVQPNGIASPRNGHIQQPALLGQRSLRLGMEDRQLTVSDTDHKDVVPFTTLGRVRIFV